MESGAEKNIPVTATTAVPEKVVPPSVFRKRFYNEFNAKSII